VDEHALTFQLAGEGAGSFVIAGYNKALFDKVASDGTHAYTTGSYEIDRFDIFSIHLLIISINRFTDLLT
jgi:hypothetical protein